MILKVLTSLLVAVLILYVKKVESSTSSIKFYFYPSCECHKPVILNFSSSLDISLDSKIIFLVHGWLENKYLDYMEELKRAFLAKSVKESSVIMVDWGTLAENSYENTINKAKTVGVLLARFMSHLIETNHFSPSQFEIVGYCMGAQIAGIAGNQIFELYGKKLPKITALDPSGPIYFHLNETERLSKDDAEVVLVIHTDAGGFGYDQPCGTIDVYPNGGVDPQPGCPEGVTVSEYDMCSHQRSHLFFRELLNRTCPFYAIQCSSYDDYVEGKCSKNKYINLAGPLSSNQKGIYFFKTRNKKPYLKKPGILAKLFPGICWFQ